MKNKTKKLTLSLILLTLISGFLSMGIFAYYSDIGKWLDQQQTPVGEGLGQERQKEDFVEDGCGTGTMLDTVTGLCWNKNLDPNATRVTAAEPSWATDTSYDEPVWNGSSYEWPSGRTDTDYPAFKVCNDLTTAGHNDWRMPQASELFTLINETGDRGTTCTTLENFGFKYCQNSRYWSANELGSSPTKAYIVSLYYGDSLINDKDFNYVVTCVRRN